MNTTASRDQFKPISIGENLVVNYLSNMKDVLYEVRCLKSNEDMILALTGQFKQLSHEPEKFR